MSMGNFIAGPVVGVFVMAATDPSTRQHESPAESSAAGMAHPTVVPTNFDPEAPGNRRD